MTGAELKERREKLGLTQRQLAEMVSYTENYILMLENGHRDITRPQILELALASLEQVPTVPAEKPKRGRKKKVESA